MVNTRTIAALLCAGLLGPAVTARAQQIAWTDRGFVNVSGGYQSGKQDVAANFSFTLYDENATVDTSHRIKGGGFFDVTGGVRVGGNWAVGVSFSARSVKSDGTVQASLPDPIFYNANRSVSSTVSGLGQREKWVGILGTYVVPATDKMDVMLFVGPAVAHVSDDVPASATVTEAAGGPQVAIAVNKVNKSVWGFTGGVDVRYLFTKALGVGAFVRYDHARASINSTKITLGGFQVAGGLRVRF
jgi:Outer membrane protein beta-barrel domain